MRVDIKGGFMGNAEVVAKNEFASPLVGIDMSIGQIASDLGDVIATSTAAMLHRPPRIHPTC